MYSPDDLSCYWNQMEANPAQPSVMLAIKLGQNIVDYATGREMPDDKLAVARRPGLPGSTPPPRGAPDRQAEAGRRLEHRAAGDSQPDGRTAPAAARISTWCCTSTTWSRATRAWSITRSIYLHGRTAFELDDSLDLLRRHLEPGGGIIFADAACGSPAFDAAFRRFVAALLRATRWCRSRATTTFIPGRWASTSPDVQYSPAAGGRLDYPDSKGSSSTATGRSSTRSTTWAVLDHHEPLECPGYTHESALRIAANIVIYATLP